MLSYDPSAGEVRTPQGKGKFIEYLGATQQVVVEIDYRNILVFPAREVFING